MRPRRHSKRPDSAGRVLLYAGVLASACIVPLALDPLGYNPFGPVKLTFAAISCAIVLAGFAVQPSYALQGWNTIRHALSAKVLGVFVGLTILSAALSIDWLQSLVGSYPEYQGVLTLFAYLLVGFTAVTLMAEDAERFSTTFGRGLAATVILLCLLALVQRMGLDPMEYRWSVNLPRARSTLGNASNFGLYLAIALPILADRIRRDRIAAWRVVAVAACGAGAIALLWTASRGAWMGLAAALVVWLVFEWSRWTRATRQRVIVTTSIAALLVAAGVGLLAPDVAARVISSADISEGTGRWRLSVWESSLRATKDSPALGWGPNSLRFVYPLYRNDDLAAGASDAQIVADAHNLFVNTAAERGVPATIVLAGWFVALLAAAWSHRMRDERGLAPAAAAASLAAGLVALQFHFLTLDTGPLFFGVAGVVTAVGAGAGVGAGIDESRTTRVKKGRPADGVVHPLLGAGLWLVVGIACTFAVLGAGLVRGDRAISRGMTLAESGAEWTQVAPHFRAARRSASWEPAMPWAEGRAAISVLQRHPDREAFEEGQAALTLASMRLRHDSRLEADHADLRLAAGLAFREEMLFAEALSGYEALIGIDPNNGVLWVGRGSALAGLGRWEEAVEDYERGVELAQRSIPGWLNLAVAYEQTGLIAYAESARERAAAITAEDRAMGAPER